MDSVFQAKEKLLQKLDWSENPFVKDLRIEDKETFLKYYYQLEAKELLKKLAFDAKACMLIGPKGVGKTSAMYFIFYSLPEEEFKSIIFKEPPQSIDELARETGFFESNDGILEGIMRALGKKPVKKEISREKLINKLKSIGKKIVFFIDEAHLEKNQDMYMEFKYLLDDVPNLRLVISALGRDGFPDSLIQLVGENNIFSRTGFTTDEMTEIITHRIKAVGGSELKPFSKAFLEEELVGQNLLSPRYVFDELNSFLASMALGEKQHAKYEYSDDPIIQSAVKYSHEQKISRANAEWWPMLSPSQQQIFELLLGGECALSEIKAKTGFTENTAFNALYQLRGEDAAERKRKPSVPFPLVKVKSVSVGARKKNVYFLTPKIKNLFTMH
ncbi:MAG: ATP-binding protein [Candidatus Micrarchaeota archaeon]